MDSKDYSSTTQAPLVSYLFRNPIFFLLLFGVVALALFVVSILALAWSFSLLGLPVTADTRFLMATIILSTMAIGVGLLLSNKTPPTPVTDTDVESSDDDESIQQAREVVEFWLTSGRQKHDFMSEQFDQFDSVSPMSAPPSKSFSRSSRRRKLRK